jgi:hypothetical protein
LQNNWCQSWVSALQLHITNAFARVTVGTIGTIINRVHLFRDVVAILVDEVHMVPPAKSSQYRKLFEKLQAAKVHGLTGTPFRADGTGDLPKRLVQSSTDTRSLTPSETDMLNLWSPSTPAKMKQLTSKDWLPSPETST